MNVGLLAFFKYMPFFLGNWAHWTGSPAPAWNWTLPLSLSFYVFQALTYTIDLYRRDAKGTRSYLAHLAAVSFFPDHARRTHHARLYADRSIRKAQELDPADGGRALFLIGMGLMKKLLIADYLARNLVNRVFDFPKLYTGAETLIAVYAYALQIYYDFSGYTDIAIGSALLLGIKLPRQFQPSLRRRKHRRFLAPLAHYALQLAARLSVFFAARQAHQVLRVREPDHHHGDRRPVARRQLELRHLGRAARLRTGRCPPVADLARQPRKPPASGATSTSSSPSTTSPSRGFSSARRLRNRHVDPSTHRLPDRFLRQYFARTRRSSWDRHAGPLCSEEVVRLESQPVRASSVLRAGRALAALVFGLQYCRPQRRGAVHLYTILRDPF